MCRLEEAISFQTFSIPNPEGVCEVKKNQLAAYELLIPCVLGKIKMLVTVLIN